MNQFTLKLEGFEENIHIDQSFKNGGIVCSAYTSWGIKVIETDYITFIQNINIKVKQLYNIDRRTGEICISPRTGKEYVSSDWKTYFEPIKIEESGKHSYGLRIEWENGETRDIHGDTYPKFDSKTKMIDGEALKTQITNNVHLHVDIKMNLLGNLENYIENKYLF